MQNKQTNKKPCDHHFEIQGDFGSSRGAGQIFPTATRKHDSAKKHSAVHCLGKMLNLTTFLQPYLENYFREHILPQIMMDKRQEEERRKALLPWAWAAELWEYPRARSAVSTSWLKSTSFRTRTNSACSSLLSYSREPSNCSTTQKTGIIKPGGTRFKSKTQTLQSKSQSPWWEGKRQL